MDNNTVLQPNRPHPLFKIATEVGPLLVFFFVNAKFHLFVATGAFMVAVLVAIAVSYWVTRHIPLMTVVTAVVVLVFGALTLLLHNETFIKMKPTIVFLIFGGVLAFGLLRGRNYLRSLLGSAFHGLSDTGWTLLARRWALFFLFLAAANELLWRFFPTDVWLHFKIWGDTLLTFLFALAQVPLMLRHGLNLKDAPEGDGENP